MSELFRSRPESHVDETVKSGSYRQAGRQEPSRADMMPGSEAEMEAYQAKVLRQVRLHLAAKQWRAADLLGNRVAVEEKVAKELHLPPQNVAQAVRELARQEETARPKPQIKLQ